MKRIGIAILILAATGGVASAQYYQPYRNGTTTYQTYGNQTYGSDGSLTQQYGNQSYLNNGRGRTTVCTTYGSQTICN